MHLLCTPYKKNYSALPVLTPFATITSTDGVDTWHVILVGKFLNGETFPTVINVQPDKLY